MGPPLMRVGVDASSSHHLDAFEGGRTGRRDSSRLPHNHQIGSTGIVHSCEERDNHRHCYPRISAVSFSATLHLSPILVGIGN
jgi:hypothetical protein